jgi:hypothetical protein
MTSDGSRKKWDISGPFFGGWEIYHVKGSGAEPFLIIGATAGG